MEGTEQTSGRTDIAIGSACTCNRGGSGCCASPEMIQDLVIRHCSPTLAGLKCGSLFRVCSVPHGIAERVAEIQGRIADKGVRIRVLEGRCGDSLLYVYRPDLLAMRMLNPDTRDFMVSEGYDVSDPETLVDQLERRLSEGIAHEIGIFLEYPLEDVLGYIENGGRGCVRLGCWKAYSDPAGAEKAFRIIKKCRCVYERRHSEGTPIEKLTVRTRNPANAASCGSIRLCGLRGSC